MAPNVVNQITFFYIADSLRMFGARLIAELVGFALSHRAQQLLTQQTNLLDYALFHFIERTTAGDQSITHVGDLVHSLSHDRVIGEALVQTLLANRGMFIVHELLKYTQF